MDAESHTPRWLAEFVVAIILGVSACAKLVAPDEAEVRYMARGFGLDSAVLSHALIALAVIEALCSLALLSRRCVEAALWASLALGFLGVAAWLGSSTVRARCACFGKLHVSPTLRLIALVVILGLSFAGLWRRLREPNPQR